MLGLYDMILWFVVGGMASIVVFIAAGPLLGPKLNDRWSQMVADFYIGQLMRFMDRAVLARRKHGGFDLFASSYDVSKESEMVKIAGDEQHFEDPRGLISTLSNKTFGIVDERYNVFTDPLVADVAGDVHEWVSDERHMNTIQTSEKERETVFTRFMPFSPTIGGVDIADTVHLLSGSASPDLTSTVEEYTRISQIGFKRADVVFIGSMAMLFCVGFGAVFLAYYVAGDSGGTTSTIGAFVIGVGL